MKGAFSKTCANDCFAINILIDASDVSPLARKNDLRKKLLELFANADSLAKTLSGTPEKSRITESILSIETENQDFCFLPMQWAKMNSGKRTASSDAERVCD